MSSLTLSRSHSDFCLEEMLLALSVSTFLSFTSFCICLPIALCFADSSSIRRLYVSANGTVALLQELLTFVAVRLFLPRGSARLPRAVANALYQIVAMVAQQFEGYIFTVNIDEVTCFGACTARVSAVARPPDATPML